LRVASVIESAGIGCTPMRSGRSADQGEHRKRYGLTRVK
jgi:hypothetical protein